MTKTKLIDDCFYVKHQRWGTCVSVHKDGHELVTSLTETQCVEATRWWLKHRQEIVHGQQTYDGTVEGKL